MTLHATIIVAVLSLVDIREMRQVWRYSISDFAAMFAPVLVTLIARVEICLPQVSSRRFCST